jgi:hypothetical protein
VKPSISREGFSTCFNRSLDSSSGKKQAHVDGIRVQLYKMIGVDTTDVKDLIMDQIQDLVKTDKVTDVGAMADYVKFIFSKFNSCVGNKTTGTLFKLTGRVISLKTWLAIGKQSDIPARSAGTMPSIEREAVRDIIKELAKLKKTGDNRDSQTDKDFRARMASSDAQIKSLQASLKRLERGGGGGDGGGGWDDPNNDSRKKKKSDRSPQQSPENKNSSFSRFISASAEKDFYDRS